jgi:hypothetical protein
MFFLWEHNVAKRELKWNTKSSCNLSNEKSSGKKKKNGFSVVTVLAY